MEILTLTTKDFLLQNTYVVKLDQSAIIIDAGVDVLDVKKAVGNLKVLAIFLTHCHYDHIKHIQEYKQQFDCDVYASEYSDVVAPNPVNNASFLFGKSESYNICNLICLHDNQKLFFKGVNITAIYSPGHTTDSMVYYFQDAKQNILFSGDTIFYNGFGRTDLPTSDNSQMQASLNKIKNLKIDYILPGHMLKLSYDTFLNNLAEQYKQ